MEVATAVKHVSGGEEFPQSVEDVEGVVWPIPPSEATSLVRTAHRLRQVPIGELSTEDLRIMLSQNVGTAAILPRALDRLEANPLAAGDFYPGDLLRAALRLRQDQWLGPAGLLDKARGIARRADAMIAELDGTQAPELRRLILEFLSDRSGFDPGRTH
ncbi:contact-dependent growth inhibition system immunity protein [Nocardia sp. NPDC059246]|uniref:contact-dependent growth inhibition system immunity protein n=1 Tax=Nocardia sp. NPDC059246 TaxID=3346789 RepID=UPI0036B003D6